jgi:hypothetical protein
VVIYLDFDRVSVISEDAFRAIKITGRGVVICTFNAE